MARKQSKSKKYDCYAYSKDKDKTIDICLACCESTCKYGTCDKLQKERSKSK